MLAGLGHEICPIQRTEEGAVAAAALRKPDLLIVDLKLAEGTGVATVERISRGGPIPYVFMSGNGFLTTTNGNVLLTKPLREADLIPTRVKDDSLPAWVKRCGTRQQESSSFLKKRTKKLLILIGSRCRNARTKG